MQMYRQGDMLLIEVDAVPSDYHETGEGTVIIGHGEVTGHHHAIRQHARFIAPAGTTSQELHAFAMRGERPKDKPLYLIVNNETTLTHDEHAPIGLKPGLFEVRRQREYFPDEIRSVAD